MEANMLGVSELLLILMIILVLFGAGKLPKVMGELGKGLRSFRDNVSEQAEAKTEAVSKKAEDK
jgi:sec-independent protein translocase protein TatA